MCTNLAIERGPHIVEIKSWKDVPEISQSGDNMIPLRPGTGDLCVHKLSENHIRKHNNW